MRVTLINPLTASITKDIMPPLGLGWLAAVLEQHGIDVTIIDALAERKDAAQAAREAAGADVVGITCITHVRGDAFDCARELKKIAPDIPVVMGGPHVTFAAEDTLKYVPAVDIIVRGEGELTFLDLLEALGRRGSPADVGGISYRENSRVVHNPDRPFIEDLDTLPFPARHLLPMSKYDFKLPFTNIPAVSVLSSRGCPIGCIYCTTSTHWGKRIRQRSPKNVVDELQHIVNTYRIRGMYFFDDTFSFHRERVFRICDEILDRKLDIRWFCESRVDVIDRELLARMKEAGLVAMAMGIESGSQRVLDIMHKQITPEQSKRAVALCHEMGIKTKTFFIYGLPGERHEDVELTFRLMNDIDTTWSPMKRIEIRPGTDIETFAIEKGLLPGHSWALTGDEIPLYVEPELTDEVVWQVQTKVLREYYLNPVWVIKRILRGNFRILTSLKAIAALYLQLLKPRSRRKKQELEP